MEHTSRSSKHINKYNKIFIPSVHGQCVRLPRWSNTDYGAVDDSALLFVSEKGNIRWVSSTNQ